MAGALDKLERARAADAARTALLSDTITFDRDGKGLTVYAPTRARATAALKHIDTTGLGRVKARTSLNTERCRGDTPGHAVFLDYNEFSKKFVYGFMLPFIQCIDSCEIVLVRNDANANVGCFPHKDGSDLYQHFVV